MGGSFIFYLRVRGATPTQAASQPLGSWLSYLRRYIYTFRLTQGKVNRGGSVLN